MILLVNMLIYKILMIPAILIAFTFHEYAHAFVADRLGDKTPKFQGRLTLNPLAHIDPLGFIMVILAGFGWAKPVQVNPRAFKNYYKDDLKVSIAGPMANILVAVVVAVILSITNKFLPQSFYNNPAIDLLITILYMTIQLNCILAFFNMMPLPGLDGSHVLRDLFPAKAYKIYEKIYPYQTVILILFIMVPWISGVLVYNPANALYGFLLKIFKI